MMARRLVRLVVLLAAAATDVSAEILISGSVLDPTGAPLAACPVELAERTTAYLEGAGELLGKLLEPVDRVGTDPGGGYAVTVPRPGIWTVTVGCPNRVEMTYQLLPLTEPVGLPPAVLYEGEEIAVLVEDPAGKRAPNATVVVHPDLAADVWRTQLFAGWRPVIRRGRSDAAGRARFLRVEGETLTAQAYARAHTFSRAEVVEGKTAKLTLRPGKRVRVTLEAPEGVPTGAVLVRLGRTRWPVEVLAEKQDFVFFADPTKENTLWFESEAGLSARHVLRPGAGAVAGPVHLRQPRTFAGRVLDEASGDPVPRAVVWRDSQPFDYAVSDATGSWRLDTRAGGPVIFHVAAAGFLDRELEGSQSAVPVRLRRAGRVHGRIATAGGEPLAGALLVAVPMAATATRVAAEVETDQGGRFEYTHLSPGSYRLELAGEHQVHRVLTLFAVEVEGGELDLGKIWLAQRARLEGRVLTRDGSPVEGARVAVTGGASSSLTVAGEDGTFRLEGLRPGTVNVEVEHPEFQDGRVRGVSVPSPDLLEVVLTASSALRGRVVDTEHRPVVGARIKFRNAGEETPPLEAATAMSDESGSFVLQDLSPGDGWLAITANEYLAKDVEVTAGAEQEDVTVVLTSGWAVEGLVLGPHARPLRAALVTLRRSSQEGMAQSAETDGRGEFRMTGLDSGGYEASVRHPDYPELVDVVQVPLEPPGLRFVLERGAEANGKVVDPLENGIAKARVTLRPVDGGGAETEVETDAGGRFEFSGMAKGAYRMVVEKEGYARGFHPREILLGDSPVEGLVVLLDEGAVVHGSVTGLGPEELSELRISAFNPTGERRPGQVEAEGSFRVKRLGQGEWILRASVGDGSRTLQRSLTIGAADREIAVDFVFEEGFELVGEVVVDGEVLAGAQILLQGGELLGQYRTLSDSVGRFALTGVTAGRYLLNVIGPGGGVRHREDLELVEDKHRLIVLETGSLSGRIFRRGDVPATTARVFLRRSGGGDHALSVVYVTEADAGGEFSFRKLAAGEYQVLVEGLPEASHVEVRAGVHEDLGTLVIEADTNSSSGGARM